MKQQFRSMIDVKDIRVDKKAVETMEVLGNVWYMDELGIRAAFEKYGFEAVQRQMNKALINLEEAFQGLVELYTKHNDMQSWLKERGE